MLHADRDEAVQYRSQPISTITAAAVISSVPNGTLGEHYWRHETDGMNATDEQKARLERRRAGR
jgi:hypothetical protein